MGTSCAYQEGTWRCPLISADQYKVCGLHLPRHHAPPNADDIFAEYVRDRAAAGGPLELHGMNIPHLGPLFEAWAQIDVVGTRIHVQGDFAPSGMKTKASLKLVESAIDGRLMLSNSTFEGEVMFQNCTIHGDVAIRRSSFTGLSLDGSRMVAAHGTVSLHRVFANRLVLARFGVAGNIDFERVLVTDLLLANQLDVNGRLEAIELSCRGRWLAYRSQIRGPTHVRKVEVYGPTAFDRSEFGGDALFQQVTCRGAAVGFNGAIFSSGTLFREFELDGATTISFDQVRFHSGAEFQAWEGPAESDPAPAIQVHIKSAFIAPESRVRFGGIATGRTTAKRFPLQRWSFLHTDVSRIRFSNVDWSQRAVYISWPRRACHWVQEHVFKRAGPHSIIRVADEAGLVDVPGFRVVPRDDKWSSSAVLLEELYRDLRKSYEQAGAQSEAGAFHRREMEMRRIALRAGEASSRSPRAELATLAAYRWLSLYGESYARAMAAIVAILGASWFVHSGGLAQLVRPGLLTSEWYRALLGALGTVFPFSASSITLYVLKAGAFVAIALFAMALRRHFMRR